MLSPDEAELKRKELEERRRIRQSERRRRALFYTLCIVMGAILLVVTAYWSYYSELPFGLSRGWGREQTTNVLLMGVDSGLEGAHRSDTLILFSLDQKSGALSALAIPRDTRVTIPGRSGFDRVNAAYAFGGPKLTVRTIERLLDVPIDYYVSLDYSGFQSIIDTLGGVVIDVEKRMWYQDQVQNLVIDLRPGVQRLSGAQSLQYVRFRSDGLGDISVLGPAADDYGGRVVRQLKLVKAILSQGLTAKNIINAPQIVSDLQDTVDADIPPDVAFQMAMHLKDMQLNDITTAILPGFSETIGGAAYWTADLAKTRETVNKLIRRLPDMVRVAVLNGNGISGVASQVANRLRENDFEVVTVGNADRFDYSETEVIANGGGMRSAEKVAQALGERVQARADAPSAEMPAEAEVVVIIGQDMIR